MLARRLTDEAEMIIWEADADGRCVYLNPGAMKGLETPCLVHIADWQPFIHPEDLPRVTAVVQEAKRRQAEYQVQYRILRSDGSERWMLSSAAPRLDPAGRLTGYLGALVDITATYEDRKRLAHSEAEHRLLTENALDLISHCDAAGNYVYVSPSHFDILGYRPQELIGTRVYDHIHPDDLILSSRPPAPGTSRLRLINLRFRHKLGHWVWLGTSTRTIRDAKTGERSGIVAVARDITAQLEAERELVRREERFRSLTSLSSDWYWETNAEGRFTFFSDGFYTRLRLSPEQLLGTTFHDTTADHDDPGFLACIDAIVKRRPFRDVTYPALAPGNPGMVRHIRMSGEPFSENGLFCGYRGVSRDVTAEVKAARALERLATRDVLTELPNRALLDERLKQRLNDRRGAVPQAVFFIDLDDFKEVNDSFGHAAGDRLLQTIARRLTQSVRPDDIVARLGGDEFVVVAECKYGATSATRIAQKLCAAVEEPVSVDGHEIKGSTSIGISLYPQDGESSEVLLQNADTALYRAKAGGGGSYCFFTAEMGAAIRTRLLLQSALRHAMQRGQFEVHYQPRMDLRTLQIGGMEALLRWTHPELGAISPAQFIPLAEETGLIDEIGAWVLGQAARQTQEWNRRYGLSLQVSVNLSTRQLRSAELVATVADALRVSALPPRLLELELTETCMIEDRDRAASMMKQLKALGIRLAVDDFGTGHSSLAYLCRFPLDCVKLDRSFLLHEHPEGISPDQLVQAMINLAHALKLSVVAEGVESKEQLEFLRRQACDEAQGFCVSAPLAPNAFEALLQEGWENRLAGSGRQAEAGMALLP